MFSMTSFEFHIIVNISVKKQHIDLNLLVKKILDRHCQMKLRSSLNIKTNSVDDTG